jgi:predicted GIY-YIG superfamily endonuclease
VTVAELPAMRVHRGGCCWKVWCVYCRDFHVHGADMSHRSAHCTAKDSPYSDGGYIGVQSAATTDAELRAMTEALVSEITAASPESEASAPAWLYRFYDGDGAVLYIGITKNLGARFSDHARNSTWWDEARNVTVQWHPDWDAADAAETAAVRAEQPRHNVAKKREPLRRRVSANA